MIFEHYVLVRNKEFMIVFVLLGNDPLYSNGSWNLWSGPFDTWQQAEDSIPDPV